MRHHPLLLATEMPYFISLLVAAVTALFAALGKVALVMLQRADRAHEAEKQSIIDGYAARLKEKDDECTRERERAERYEEYTLRLLETARQATAVATDAVSKRGGP